MRASWICDRLIRAAAAAGIRGPGTAPNPGACGCSTAAAARKSLRFSPRGIWPRMSWDAPKVRGWWVVGDGRWGGVGEEERAERRWSRGLTGKMAWRKGQRGGSRAPCGVGLLMRVARGELIRAPQRVKWGKLQDNVRDGFCSSLFPAQNMFSRIVKKCWLCHTVKMKFRENKDGATSLGEIDQVNEGAIGLQERPFDHFRVVTSESPSNHLSPFFRSQSSLRSHKFHGCSIIFFLDLFSN